MQHVIGHLDQVTRGDCRRLMLFLPPRHGKSELATVRYPVYRLAARPETRVIVGAYNQTLANTFSRKARRVAGQAGLALSGERSAVEQWETAAGGGLRAVGVGGGVTGQGGDVIVIDDPVKSREEADSAAYRQRVWDWYTDDLYTRLEPSGALILIMTRWHQDDLAGRILDSADAGDWTVVRLPAEAEPDDPLGRAPGAPLNPARFPADALARIRRVLGHSYQALYQQRPQPREGGLFKAHWLPLADIAPASPRWRLVRWWDLAATADGGDWTVGVLMGELDGLYWVLDVVRGQWSSGERDRVIRVTADRDAQQYGVGAVQHWAGQEPGSGGKDQAAAFRKNLAGHTAHTEPETGSKTVRAEPFAAQCEAGNVRVLARPWAPAYVGELLEFPTGGHDDQVDPSAGAFNKLALGATAAEAADSPLGDYRG